MATVYPNIHVKKNPGKYSWFELTTDCIYKDTRIKKGFCTNGPSVWRFLWWLVPPHGRSFNPSVLHDFRYEHSEDRSKEGRKRVDDEFLQLLYFAGVAGWQRYLMYYYVRLLGWKTWNYYTKILSG